MTGFWIFGRTLLGTLDWLACYRVSFTVLPFFLSPSSCPPLPGHLRRARVCWFTHFIFTYLITYWLDSPFSFYVGRYGRYRPLETQKSLPAAGGACYGDFVLLNWDVPALEICFSFIIFFLGSCFSVVLFYFLRRVAFTLGMAFDFAEFIEIWFLFKFSTRFTGFYQVLEGCTGFNAIDFLSVFDLFIRFRFFKKETLEKWNNSNLIQVWSDFHDRHRVKLSSTRLNTVNCDFYRINLSMDLKWFDLVGLGIFFLKGYLMRVK